MDRKLKRLNARVNFHIDVLSFELTGNKSDIKGNKKLMSFGFEDQHISVSKKSSNFLLIIFFYFRWLNKNKS